MILFEVVDVEVLQQLRVGEGPVAEFDKGAIKVFAQSQAQIRFGNMVFLEEDGLEIQRPLHGFGQGRVQFFPTYQTDPYEAVKGPGSRQF